MSHMIQALGVHTDSHRQTDQSGLETKAGSVLFLPANEREEFSINLFHLVLRGRCTKQCMRWIRWVVSPSPPSGSPVAVPTELLEACVLRCQDMCVLHTAAHMDATAA